MPVSSVSSWIRSYAGTVIVDLSGRGDVTTIAAAVTRVNAYSGGGSIVLSEGTHSFPASATATVPIHFKGQGKCTRVNMTGAAGFAINSADCLVEDMWIDGCRINVNPGSHRFIARNLHVTNGYSDSAIKIHDSHNTLVENCLFESITGPAVTLTGTVNYNATRFNVVLSISSASTIFAGQAGSGGTGNKVYGNEIYDSRYFAIEYNGDWAETWINDNFIRVTVNTGSGISLVGLPGTDSMICRNHIELSSPIGGTGIECGTDRTLVKENIFKGGILAPIALNNGAQIKDVIIESNIFRCTNVTGIAIGMAAGTGRNIAIRNNQIINSNQTAINCAGLSFSDISHNVIRYESATYGTTAATGINLHNMTDSTVKANNIYNNTNANSTCMSTGQAAFTRNTMDGNHEDGGGVLGYGMGCSVVNSNNVLANHVSINFVTRALSFNAGMVDWTFTNIYATQLCDMPSVYIESGGNPTSHNVIPPTYVSVNSPEGLISAPVGALCKRRGGGASTTLYVKESGSGSTGWVAK